MSIFDYAKNKISSTFEETIDETDKVSKNKKKDKAKPTTKEEKKSVSDRFLDRLAKNHQKRQDELKDVVVPEVKSSKITDVLELLKIPATFEVGYDVFMPDDIDKVVFDLEMPKGYERAEVDSFKAKAKSSLEYFVSLLKQRNEHVAQLATVIDRLQVDLNNLKWQAEMSEGITVIPTSNEDLENENNELRILVEQLQAKLNNETDFIDDNALSEQVALLQREINDLKVENETLRNSLRMHEENSDEDFYSFEEQEESFLREYRQNLKDDDVSFDELLNSMNK